MAIDKIRPGMSLPVISRLQNEEFGSVNQKVKDVEDAALGVKRGRIEPSEVKFTAINNQFIDEGIYPSISLGTVPIVEEIYGFEIFLSIDKDKSDIPVVTNRIILKDKSKIQSGQKITITGDQDFELSNTIAKWDRYTTEEVIEGQEKSILFLEKNEIGWLNLGDTITVSGMPEDFTVSWQVPTLGELGRITEDGYQTVKFVNGNDEGISVINSLYLAGLTVTVSNSFDPLLNGEYTILTNTDNTIELITNYRPGIDPINNLEFGSNPAFSVNIPSDNGTYQIINLDKGIFPVLNKSFRIINASADIIKQTLVDNDLAEFTFQIEYFKEAISGTFTVIDTKEIEISVDPTDEKLFTTVTVLSVEESIPTTKPAANDAIGNWEKIVKVELSWVHGVMPNGVVIWEAYNNEDVSDIAFEGINDINGYWVALKDNGQGEWVYLSHLKMTDSFWTNWYDYTYKEDANPNQLKLIGWNYTEDGGAPWDTRSNVGSYIATLNLTTDNQLEIVETFFNMDKTWTELYTDEFGDFTFNERLNVSTPWYDSDDDWYGMQKGENAGWVWIWKSEEQSVIGGNSLLNYQLVGFNMLSGETEILDFSEDQFFMNFSIISVTSNAKYKYLFGLIDIQEKNAGLDDIFKNKNVDFVSPNQYLWSSNFQNPLNPTLINVNDENGNLIELFTFGFSYEIVDNYAYVFKIAGNYVNFIRIKLETDVVEYIKQPIYGSSIISNIDWFPYWVTKNSVIVKRVDDSYNFQSYNFQNVPELIVLNNNQSQAKIVLSSVYPYNFTNDSTLEYDTIWDQQQIISTTEKFKKDTF